jgi:hypothetical protein
MIKEFMRNMNAARLMSTTVAALTSHMIFKPLGKTLVKEKSHPQARCVTNEHFDEAKEMEKFNGAKKIVAQRFSCFSIMLISLLLIPTAHANAETIDREKVVATFSPVVKTLDKLSPFTLGNGKFAFTADATGFQSFAEEYFAAGFPLETKARWAWHTKPGNNYSLTAANKEYSAYNRKVNFPTEMDSVPAQWLRQNPHDLPLGRIALLLDGKKLTAEKISGIEQHLDLWRGKLTSRYALDGTAVLTESATHAERDLTGFKIASPLIDKSRLSIQLRFPRGYDFSVKNTPDIDWQNDSEHTTAVRKKTKNSLLLERKVDDEIYIVAVNWKGKASIKSNSPHTFEIVPAGTNKTFEFTVEYFEHNEKNHKALTFNRITASAESYWQGYWQNGAFVDLTRSTDKNAHELQRRILLSQYLLAAQARASIPTQETGLTSSSWYGKFHTEMAWLHYSHWILWNRSEGALPILDWYVQNLDKAQAIAKYRGLDGARWPKMVGPDGRESPGGNSLIIWNQPHPIHLAEMLFEKTQNKNVLKKYAAVVEESARAMSSMLTWDEKNNRYNLDAPIWIAQEIYTPEESRNPTYELAYWRYGLETAQQWRLRQGLPANEHWQKQLASLAALPIKDGKYVAMESIPDTFDNIKSREDHPSMLAPTAFFNDANIDKKIMNNTLDAIVQSWAFETHIWGWDYPMMAMAAARLERRDIAVQLLLMNSRNNHYLGNGHVPQLGSELAVYLPANSSMLSAVAIMLQKNPQTGEYLGFPNNKQWDIRTEGF